MDNNQNDFNRRKMKKRIIIVFAVSVAALILAFVLVSILENVTKKMVEDEFVGRKYSIIYCDPIEDIFRDKEYMELNRTIYYHDAATGVTYALDDDTKCDYGDAVELLYDYVKDIIKGDLEAYNDYFSDIYYSTKINGKLREEKTYLHPQELYGICITKEAEPTKPDDNSGFVQYEYSLTFRIHKNNGSFRLGIDHDAEKREYYVITDRSGDLKIDNYFDFKYN